MAEQGHEYPKIHPNDLATELENSEVPIKAESSIIFEDKYDEDAVLLKYARSRPSFLLKLGFHFLIYFGFMLAALSWVLLKKDQARQFAEDTKIIEYKWCALAAIVVIKITYGFFGFTLRRFSKLFFFLDIMLSCWLVIGLYFYFNGFVKDLFESNGHYFFIILIDLIFCSFTFMLTSLIKNNDKIYVYWAGIISMNIVNGLTLYVAGKVYFVPGMVYTRYYQIFICILAWNIYFAINAYFVVNYRTKKFYQYEQIYCFFCFFIDWCSFFWIDTVSSRVRRLKINRAEHIENALDEKERELERREQAQNESNNNEIIVQNE